MRCVSACFADMRRAAPFVGAEDVVTARCYSTEPGHGKGAPNRAYGYCKRKKGAQYDTRTQGAICATRKRPA